MTIDLGLNLASTINFVITDRLLSGMSLTVTNKQPKQTITFFIRLNLKGLFILSVYLLKNIDTRVERKVFAVLCNKNLWLRTWDDVRIAILHENQLNSTL